MARLALLGLAVALAPALAAQTTMPAAKAPETRVFTRSPVQVESGPFQTARNGARLVVLITVDQLSTEVLAAAWPFLGEDGFRRLAREGTSCPRCAYLHACTETGPGHATLGTGATPAIHGIVGNDWIDAMTTEILGCVEDRRTRLFSSGDPGASAHRLLAPTLGDALRVAFGSRAKVASVSIKDRSAILVAGASADFVTWLDRKTGLFTTSTAFASGESGAEPGWLGELNRSRALDDITDFEWKRIGPESAYAGLPPDDEVAEYPLGGSRTLPRRLLREHAKSAAEFRDWLAYSPAGLEITFSHARFLLAKAELGKDEIPDILAVGASSNDYVGHLFGPDSHEVRDMTLRTDTLLAQFLKHLDEVVGRGRYVVMLSADHGIGPTPEIAVRRGIAAGRVSADKFKLAVEGAMRERFGIPPPGEHWVAKVLDSDMLLNRKLLEARKIPLVEAQDFAAGAVEDAHGVAEGIPLHAVFEGNLTPTAIHDAIRRAHVRSRSVDVYVLPKPYHTFSKYVASHGTPYDYDRRVPLFLYGPGMKKGHEVLGPTAPGSGVVTIAAALGIGGPAAADHPVLEDALERPR